MKKPINEVQEAEGDSEPVGLDPSDPIISQLRGIYDDVASEPLPPEMLDLLAKLDEAERNR